jgi:DNA-binding NtrC family response regulator
MTTPDSLRILVVDDEPLMLQTVQDIFRVKGYQSEVAPGGAEAMRKISQTRFDFVLCDIKMPDLNGVELYRAIKAIQPNLPVVLMTAFANDALVQEGLAEGVISVLNKPLDMNLLFKFLSYLSRQRSILIVDDDPDFCQSLADILRLQGFLVTVTTKPHEVVPKLAEGQIVLLDMKLKDGNGLDVLREIKKQNSKLPVILVTGYREEVASTVNTALEINAYTCFYKPLPIERLLQTLNQIHHQLLGQILGRPLKKIGL